LKAKDLSIMKALPPIGRPARVLYATAAISICSMVFAEHALAHHSYAAYDQNHVNSVEGTLKDFDWSAPHSSVTVVYVDKSGGAQTVSATTGAPNTIVRQGFKISDFKAGMKVELKWYPNINGAPGGELALLKLPDNRVLRGHGFEDFGANNSPKADPAKAK